MFCLFSRNAGEKLGWSSCFIAVAINLFLALSGLRLESISDRDNRLVSDPHYSPILFIFTNGTECAGGCLRIR